MKFIILFFVFMTGLVLGIHLANGNQLLYIDDSESSMLVLQKIETDYIVEFFYN